MATHYNHSIKPDKNTLPACQLGGDWGRDFSGWAATTDKAKVTCKRCRKVMRIDQKETERRG